MTGARAALVVAHPSHELLLHGWLERARPRVSVLTDGAGHGGTPRLDATTRLLAQLRLAHGAAYGRLTDRAIYAAVLAADVRPFLPVVEALAADFAACGIDTVVGDAAEGYSVVHDLGRFLLDCAVELAERRSGRAIAVYETAVVAPPPGDATGDDASVIELDDAALARKLDAACRYDDELAAEIAAARRGGAFQGIRRFSEAHLSASLEPTLRGQVLREMNAYPVLRQRIEAVLDGVPLAALRREVLRPVRRGARARASTEAPFYEWYGALLVAAGRYRQAIRCAEHMAPLMDMIRGCLLDARPAAINA